MRVPPGGFWGAGTTPDRRAGLAGYSAGDDTVQLPYDLGEEPILRVDNYTTADNTGLWLLLFLALGVGAGYLKKER